MPKRARRPAQLVGRMFLGRTVVAQGLLTRADLRSTAWQKLFNGVYADAQMDITHADRCLAATRFVLPPTAVVAGRSAALLYGIPMERWRDEPQPVEVI